MLTLTRTSRQFPRACVLAVTMGLASFGASAAEIAVTLSGDQEVPPVTTMASGTAKFTVKDDMSLSGSVNTQDVKATAAHIHSAVAGENGPVVVTLTREGDNQWVVPAGATLTAAQMKELKAGGMYINVHSAAHPGGEIRAQLK